MKSPRLLLSGCSIKSKHPAIIHPDNRPDRGLLVPVRYLGKRFYQEWIASKRRRPIKSWLAVEIESRGNPILPDNSLIVGVHEWSVMLVDDAENGSWAPVCIELFNREHSHLVELCKIGGKTGRLPVFCRSYYFTSVIHSRIFFTIGLALVDKGNIDPDKDGLPFGEELYQAAHELNKSLEAKRRGGNQKRGL